MINLLPPEGHKAVKREYLLRVGATFGFLFGGVCVLLTVALIPTFVLVRAQMQSTVAREGSATEEAAMLLVAEQEVRTTESILAQLKSVPRSTAASDIIAELQQLAPSGVQFNIFSMEKTNGIYGNVRVSGIASTREILSELRQAIEASDMFATAVLPIADLARDANLPFELTVTLNPPE